MNIYINDGSPQRTQQAATTLEKAKDFLSKYQNISSDSYYKNLGSMLDNIQANENITKTSGNVMLTITTNSDYTSYRWTYTVNGVEAPSKCVALKFENDFLKYFIDTWSLCTIGSTDMKISEEEAVKIAMNRAKNYTWNVLMGDNPPVTVTKFNISGVSETKLQIGNYATKNDSRDGNPLTLYPVWRIKLYFDKLYLGQVYGVDVGIWADTGEISDIRTLKYLGDHTGLELNESADNETVSTPVSLLAVLPIAALIGVTIVYSKRKSSYKISNESKIDFLKLRGALLCFLLAITVISMASATSVKAGTYVMPLYGVDYGEAEEVEAASGVIDVWESHFYEWTDYTMYDFFGDDTQRENVLGNAVAFEQYFDHVAMFHYGHGGMNMSALHHRDYLDNDNSTDPDDQIWDYDVYAHTGSSKHFFVFLWVCRQGDFIGGYNATEGTYYGRYGMPYCWFHGNPSSGDCFIGFEGASMPITQQSANSTVFDYELWLKGVGIRLSYSHHTVKQALDGASNLYFHCDYMETELHLGFWAIWVEDQWGGSGKMKVYGNWNIQVY